MRNIGGLLVGEGPRGDQGKGREEGEEGRGKRRSGGKEIFYGISTIDCAWRVWSMMMMR